MKIDRRLLLGDPQFRLLLVTAVSCLSFDLLTFCSDSDIRRNIRLLQNRID